MPVDASLMRFTLGSFRPEMLFALLGRLLLIVLLSEVLVMFAYRWFGFGALPEVTAAILDGVLLTVLSAPLIYFWIIVPLLRERRRSDDTLHLLATLTRPSQEAIFMTDHDTGIEYARPFVSPACDDAEKAPTAQDRC